MAIQHCIQMAGSTAQQQQSGRELWMQEDFGIGTTKHAPGATEHAPIVEVAFANGKWWSIPQEMSSQLYATQLARDPQFSVPWGEAFHFHLSSSSLSPSRVLTPDTAMDWRSTSIPLSIRRPWAVFEQDLEDKLGDAASQGGKASESVRLQVAMAPTHGVLRAFLRLPEDVQRS